MVVIGIGCDLYNWDKDVVPDLQLGPASSEGEGFGFVILFCFKIWTIFRWSLLNYFSINQLQYQNHKLKFKFSNSTWFPPCLSRAIFVFRDLFPLLFQFQPFIHTFELKILHKKKIVELTGFEPGPPTSPSQQEAGT